MAAIETEWSVPSDDANPVSLPSMVSSSDLFDGELFGDELIDIYNSTVEEGEGIPHLEPPGDDKDAEIGEDHLGAQVAVVAAAMDDGLGAFRPSTSFNDLTALVQPQAAPASKMETPSLAIARTTKAAAPPAVASPKSAGKKRSAAASPSTPPAKKKAAPRARKPAAAKKQSSPSAASKKKMVVDIVMSGTDAPSYVVSPSGEDPAATAAAVQTAAAAAAAANFPPLPNFNEHAKVISSGVKLALKREEKPEPATSASPSDPPTLSAPAGTTLPKTTPSDSSTSSAAAAAGIADKTAVTSSDAASTDTDSAPLVGAETQFKSVAQQAVSNLILNVSTGKVAPAAAVSATTAVPMDVSDDTSKTVDTSTAHIKALTGNNWVAACTSTVTAVAAPATTSSSRSPSPTSSAAATDKNNRARRQNLTPDERARQNRDRNREHARNTRLRKKAYVEELKRTLTELVAQRDAADLEKRQSAQRELEQREVRFRVIEEFLKLRGRNEANFTRWSAILEDGFVLTVPSTSLYKNTAGGEIVRFEQKLGTVEAVMAESTTFFAFLQQALRRDGEGAITLAYNCDRKNFFMDNCNAVLEWTASTAGAKEELQLKGLMRGKFSPASNKLLAAQILFDCGSIATQINAMKATFSASANDVAAQADAILDSLEINNVHMNVVVPSDVSVHVHSSASVSDESSSEHSSSDHKTDADVTDGLVMIAHRVHRRD